MPWSVGIPRPLSSASSRRSGVTRGFTGSTVSTGIGLGCASGGCSSRPIGPGVGHAVNAGTVRRLTNYSRVGGVVRTAASVFGMEFCTWTRTTVFGAGRNHA